MIIFGCRFFIGLLSRECDIAAGGLRDDLANDETRKIEG